MEKLSVVIISFNEENNIGRCIDSVKDVADEIVVLDSFSTDQTVRIAAEKGAIVKQQAFKGYIETKNDALALASNHYVLSLDADEALDQTLRDSILKVKENLTASAYRMNRCTHYCGQFIRHGSWYPDRKLRLFDKRIARWGGTNPHDKIELDRNLPVVWIKGDILHYSYPSVADHVAQNNKFSTIAAATLFRKGKRAGILNILFNPSWAFFQSYFLRAGFLDGFFGLVIAIQIAHMTFLKYVKLYLLQKSAE
jgi:glycosyltransferase involved in cell wall biosynthesis